MSFATASLKRKLCELLFAIGSIGAVVAAVFGYQHYGDLEMTDEIKTMKMKAVCVGRFLIDVPEDAQVSYRPANVSRWKIVSDPDESEETFAERVKVRADELKQAQNDQGEASLELVKSITEDRVIGKIFKFGRTWSHHYMSGKRVDENWVTMQAYMRTDGVSFDFTGEFLDDNLFDDLTRIVKLVRARGEQEIPAEPGFCFDRGLIAEPADTGGLEALVAFVTLKDHPDVSIALNTSSRAVPSDTLLERETKAKSDFSQGDQARFIELRRGQRQAGGMEGQEILEKVAEHNGSTRQSFMWESLHNKPKEVNAPFVTFEMSTGHGKSGTPVTSSLGDGAAVALWDRMLGSVRLRPVQAGAVTKPETAATAVGTRAMAGDLCVHSGWWQCLDGQGSVGVEGGCTQFFSAGQELPQAVLLPPPTLWQRVRGEQSTFVSKIPSSWKLVDRRKIARTHPSTLLEAAGPIQQRHVEQPAVVDNLGYNGDLSSSNQLASGAVCSVSGWWKCSEPRCLDGTRWFAAGAILPKATEQVELSAIEKLRGIPPFVRVMATWQLVRTDAAHLQEDGSATIGAVERLYGGENA